MGTIDTIMVIVSLFTGGIVVATLLHLRKRLEYERQLRLLDLKERIADRARAARQEDSDDYDGYEGRLEKYTAVSADILV